MGIGSIDANARVGLTSGMMHRYREAIGMPRAGVITYTEAQLRQIEICRDVQGAMRSLLGGHNSGCFQRSLLAGVVTDIENNNQHVFRNEEYVIILRRK